jgi:hypothetical protein
MDLTTKSNDDITEVVFLKDKEEGNVFAYFKNFTNYPDGSRECCDFLGHSACSPDYASECEYASAEEYLPLYKHLSKIGYNLKVEDNPEMPTIAYIPTPSIEDYVLLVLEQEGSINDIEALFLNRRLPEGFADTLVSFGEGGESFALGENTEVLCCTNEYGEPLVVYEGKEFDVHSFLSTMSEDGFDVLSSEFSPILRETGIAIANASGYKYDDDEEGFYKRVDAKYPDEHIVYANPTNIAQVAGLIDVKPTALLDALKEGSLFVERSYPEERISPSIEVEEKVGDQVKAKKSKSNSLKP